MNASKVTYIEDEPGQDIPVTVKPKRQPEPPLSQKVNNLMKQERFWATVVHAITPLMIGLFFIADGPEWIGLMCVTGAIWIYNHNRSAFVSHHARQALAVQLIGSFGWLAIIIGGAVAWVLLLVLSALAMLVLVGFLLFPIVLVSYPLLVLASFAMPITAALLGAVAAWETWHGRHFAYPRLSDWLDKQFGTLYTIV
jgi:uncharacterized Tic20 family protein